MSYKTCGRIPLERSTSGSEDDTANVELGAWSKLWRPGTPRLQKQQGGKASDWTFFTLRSSSIVPRRYLAVCLKSVEAKASWPPDLREMLYLQLPKEEA
eukprot:6192775-Amphidinium_carterae.1